MLFHFVTVPGMLEYESIPGVSSSKPFGGRTKAHADITVKSITKMVSSFFCILTCLIIDSIHSCVLLCLRVMHVISFQLSNFLAILNAHCVDPEIIKQVFRQVYCYGHFVKCYSFPRLLNKD